MKAERLRDAIKIVSKLKTDFSATVMGRIYQQPKLYQVEIGPDSVKAVNNAGYLEISLPETGLDEPCLFELNSLREVAQSLEGEVYLRREGTSVFWESTQDSGSLNLLAPEFIIPDIVLKSPFKPPDGFASALELGSSAIEAGTYSFDLYGMTIQPQGDILTMASTCTTALAVASISKGDYPLDDKITIQPPAPTLLSHLLKSHPDSMLDISEDGLSIENEYLRAAFPLHKPLSTDVIELASEYSGREYVTRFDRTKITNFLRHAKGLEKRFGDRFVYFSVDSGKLILTKDDGLDTDNNPPLGVADFYLLADDLDSSVQFEGIKLPMNMLSVPLKHTDSLVLDYFQSNAAVFVKETDEISFQYVVSGLSK